MYELFVLGELMDQPLHGYLLHSIVQRAIGPVRQVSWGALYPLIRRLQQQGLITQEEDGERAGGRQRKVYRITDAGRTRFHALLREPGAYDADYPDLFSIKLVNFDHLTLHEQVEILRHYHGYLRFSHDYMQASRRHIATEAQIPVAERPHILQAIDHRLHVVRADMEWVEARIAAITQEQEASTSQRS